MLDVPKGRSRTTAVRLELAAARKNLCELEGFNTDSSPCLLELRLPEPVRHRFAAARATYFASWPPCILSESGL